jgi:hypothetical protein
MDSVAHSEVSGEPFEVAPQTSGPVMRLFQGISFTLADKKEVMINAAAYDTSVRPQQELMILWIFEQSYIDQHWLREQVDHRSRDGLQATTSDPLYIYSIGNDSHIAHAIGAA